MSADIVRPLVAMVKPAASFSDHGWRAIAMCGTKWMVAARYEDAVTVEDGVVTKTWDAEAHARLFAAAPDLLKVAQDFAESLSELGMLCECGESDCRTTRLRAAIAKAGKS